MDYIALEFLKALLRNLHLFNFKYYLIFNLNFCEQAKTPYVIKHYFTPHILWLTFMENTQITTYVCFD